jgi:hypothetical protein
MSLGAFGTGGLLVEDGMSRGHPLSLDPAGAALAYRGCVGQNRRLLLALHLDRAPGDRRSSAKNALPESDLKYEDNEPERQFEFIFHVCPNEQRIKGNVGYARHEIPRLP